MQAEVFISRLKRANRKLVINKLPGKVWGIALKMPRHPDANEHGFLSLVSMPSPSWYSNSLPPETIRSSEGQIQARGWKVILRLLVTQGHFKKRIINSLFGKTWEVA